MIDQNGQPVEGVTVDYTGSRSLSTSGSGVGKIVTDQSGRFVIEDAKGESLHIRRLSKFGYQFPDLDRFYMPRSGPKLERYWSDFDEDSPFLIKSWKVDQLPILLSGRDVILSIKTDGKDQVVRFDREKAVVVGSNEQGHIILNFSKATSSWRLQLKSERGGYQKTGDYFLYDAPDSGYASVLSIGGKDILRKKENLYFLSSDGRSYGAFRLYIRPGLSHENAKLHFAYSINLEGGRSLVLREKNHNDLL